MSTDNIRVAGYIKPKIHDCFEEFCEEKNLTISKGLNVILAEYFGIQDNLDDRTNIGGVTLNEFEELKKKVDELSNILNELKSSSKNSKRESEINTSLNRKVSNKAPVELSTTLLAKRLGVTSKLINQQKKKFQEGEITRRQYIEWSRSLDPDGNPWFFDGKFNFSL